MCCLCHGILYHATYCYAKQCHAMACCVTVYNAVPHHAMACRATSCHAASCCSVPCRAMPCPAMPYLLCRTVAWAVQRCVVPRQPTPSGAPHAADPRAPARHFPVVPPAARGSASSLQPWWEGAYTPEGRAVVSWGIGKPPYTLGLAGTATQQCRAANKSETQLPLPPLSDWQGGISLSRHPLQ